MKPDEAEILTGIEAALALGLVRVTGCDWSELEGKFWVTVGGQFVTQRDGNLCVFYPIEELKNRIVAEENAPPGVGRIEKTPLYTHDCEKCIYLGTYQQDGVLYDLYHADHGGLPDTIIARYGNDEPMYYSGMGFGREYPGHPLREAYKRAINLGLVTEVRAGVTETQKELPQACDWLDRIEILLKQLVESTSNYKEIAHQIMHSDISTYQAAMMRGVEQ